MSRCCAIALVLLVAACGGDAGREPKRVDATGTERDADGGWFSERAKEAGIDFVHVNGMSGELYLTELMAPGVALFDFDNDGDLDVYLVQGQPLPKDASAEQKPPASRPAFGTGPVAPRPSGMSDRLYRNDLRINADGTRTLQFVDVTSQSGIDARGYGMGVAAGDIDNDGWIDLYLTKYDAPNQLLRNNGNGTFSDISARSGTDQRSWSVSAAFVDFDRDGWLDLYVGNYLRYGLSGHARCFSASGSPGYCTPASTPPLPDRLYRNERNGRFRDVTAAAGVAAEFGPALGVATADFNQDGWIDIYVANDGMDNQLWLNRKNGTFENGALIAGVAVPVHGKPEASMGVDAGDFDNDGDEDLIMTELTGEGSNLYVNDGSGVFDDRSVQSAIGPATLAFTGFGTGWIDVDSDGRLDILAVNGAVQMIERLRQAGDPYPVHQPRLLLRNAGSGRFEDATKRAGAIFAGSEVGRGVAFGDVDNDGDTDVLVGNNNGPTRLFVNEASGHHWLGLRLLGERGNRDMVGARVQVTRGDGTIWRRARTDGSYASASDPRVLVGLGRSSERPRVRVLWPNGRTETWNDVEIDRYVTLREGEGR